MCCRCEYILVVKKGKKKRYCHGKKCIVFPLIVRINDSLDSLTVTAQALRRKNCQNFLDSVIVTALALRRKKQPKFPKGLVNEFSAFNILSTGGGESEM